MNWAVAVANAAQVLADIQAGIILIDQIGR